MKPATALPWKYITNIGPTQGLIVEEDGTTILACVNNLGRSGFEPNLRYVTHAANAYPRLMETLQEVLRDRLTQTNLHHMPPGIRKRLEKAKALLQELGAT